MEGVGRAKTKRNDALNQYVEATEICIRTKTTTVPTVFSRRPRLSSLSLSFHLSLSLSLAPSCTAVSWRGSVGATGSSRLWLEQGRNRGWVGGWRGKRERERGCTIPRVVVNEEKRRWGEIKDEAGTKITTRERRPPCPPRFSASLHPRQATPHPSNPLGFSTGYVPPPFHSHSLSLSFLLFFVLSHPLFHFS